MAILKKYNLEGSEVGKEEIADNLLKASVNSQLIKDYLVAIRNNARQWSAKTKSRAEVNHSGKKPHPQKGTGRARQGYLGAPQYKGGGRVHAPKPKFDQHVKINQKEKRCAIRQLIIEKIQKNRVHILETPHIRTPKTQKIAQFLKTRELAGKRVLFLAEMPEKNETARAALLKSLRNIPKTRLMLLPNASGYDIAVNHELVFLEPTVAALKLLLGEGNV